ncbi:MAG: 30S ribosomal protein S3 [Acidobacteriota bacterium]|nr:30S ribosomal protein S3 [Acidobacteriota bacterium]OQB56038.1 MAG: 30S ribosomal protein S3 [Candidatus Aminicenantes bacterium ADurb.Bin147]HNQ79540.1 30S ribosomal protein S3 [Candidatus Aminicenantes bacterium]MDD8010112.1 30S ribosomal protein S3 [Acidobacteriota bacterium]MDD8029747.1 30S ribosomal protein S3 [Acidobacteriota bacterium]
MGQKTHPHGFRLGFNKQWSSRWFAKGPEYARLIHEDLRMKQEIKKKYAHAGISEVAVERVGPKIRVLIFTARPGIIIGRGGKEIESLKHHLESIVKREVYVDIREVEKPELVALLVAEGIAVQLEKRIAYRRAMRKAVEMALKMGAKGIKVMCAGRLGGVEIARSEWYLRGQLPLQTLKADIDYGFTEAFTTYGQIGIKVWIYRGDTEKAKMTSQTAEVEEI